MIGKITMGKSFRGCLLYCLNDKQQEQENQSVMKDRAEILMFNQCFGNQREIVQQFEDVRRLNMKLAKPVLHITLSLAPGEKLPKNELMQMCEDCARDLKFENNQFVAIHHKDTDHQHIHIVANRIGFDGRTVSDSNNYQKIASYCRKMELKHELKQVLSPRLYLSQKQRLIQRFDSRKEKIKRDIRLALKESLRMDQFESKMREKNYQIIRARGILFIDEKKMKVKGSELGFSLGTIEKILEVKQALSLKQLHQSEQLETKQILSNRYRSPGLLQQKNNSAKELKNEIKSDHDLKISKESLKLLDKLLEPKEMSEELAYEFSQRAYEKKRKQRQRQIQSWSQHL